jgi:membrane fusion protein (multidrug efflux system)
MNKPERPELLIQERPPRRRRLWLWMTIVVLASALLFAAIFAFRSPPFMSKGFPAPPATAVSTTAAVFEEWQPPDPGRGIAQAGAWRRPFVEVSGIVDEVSFDSGGDVKAGAQIIKLRDTDDLAKLHTLEASRDLWQGQFQPRSGAASEAAYQPGAIRYHFVESEAIAGADRRAAGDRRQKDLCVRRSTAISGIRSVNEGQFVNPGTGGR